MASQYDSIQTPKELLTEVAMHGFSTKIEDVCRAQDIFGRAPIEDLVFLANDIGRVNENGEPDPEGAWSSGRRGTRAIFYQILFHIWNWEDATRFYNQHSNPDRKRIIDLENQNNDLARKLIETEKKAADSNEAYESVRERLDRQNQLSVQTQADRAEVEWKLAEAEHEIIRLKAKLYDLMVSKEEK